MLNLFNLEAVYQLPIANKEAKIPSCVVNPKRYNVIFILIIDDIVMAYYAHERRYEASIITSQYPNALIVAVLEYKFVGEKWSLESREYEWFEDFDPTDYKRIEIFKEFIQHKANSGTSRI